MTIFAYSIKTFAYDTNLLPYVLTLGCLCLKMKALLKIYNNTIGTTALSLLIALYKWTDVRITVLL